MSTRDARIHLVGPWHPRSTVLGSRPLSSNHVRPIAMALFALAPHRQTTLARFDAILGRIVQASETQVPAEERDSAARQASKPAG